MKDTNIMGEKEFFDIMKNSNRFLSMKERHSIATLVENITKTRRSNK